MERRGGHRLGRAHVEPGRRRRRTRLDQDAGQGLRIADDRCPRQAVREPRLESRDQEAVEGRPIDDVDAPLEWLDHDDLGSAQNPMSMNRFLYAGANPTTLVDPTGHWFENFDPLGFAGQVASNVGNFGVGVVEGAVGSLVDAGVGIVQTTVAAGGCAISDSCRRDIASSIQKAAVAFSRDPAKALGNAATAVVKGAGDAIGSAANRVGTAWSTGNFRELGKVTGEVAVNFVPVGGVLARGGQALRGLAGSSRFFRGASELAAATRGGRAAQSLAGRVGGGASCALRMINSFAPETLVATAAGPVRIAAINVGDEVTAWDEETGQTGPQRVSAVHVNDDPVTGTVVIDGEVIHTTPEHPFYTIERGWLNAEDLETGLHVPSADGLPGSVGSVLWTGGPAVMYNLTVDVAHTFFVGSGGWLVHNTCGPDVTYRNGWRTPDGKFASPKDGRRPGRSAEEAVWDAVDAKPGWTAIRRQISVVDDRGRRRRYDGGAQREGRERVIGLETKSGKARRNAHQRTFDRRLSQTRPARGVGKSKGIVIPRARMIKML